MEQLTFLSEEPPANPFQSPESGLDWMTRAATSRLNMSAWLNALMPSGWSSRTSPVFSQAQKETTLQPLSAPLLDMITGHLPRDGETPESPKGNPDDGDSLGECLTLSISEWPRDAAVCSLSDIVETGDLRSGTT